MAESWDGAAGARARLLVAACAVIVTGALLVALAFGAAIADAAVAKLGGQGYGITPIDAAGEASLAATYRAQRSASPGSSARPFDEPPFGGSELKNAESGPVMHSVTTHVVYWDPPAAQFTATTKGIVGSFFADVAHDSGLATNVFAIAGQYADGSGHAAYSSTFAGALVDSHAYPTTGNCTIPTGVDEGPYATCLSDHQLQQELTTFIGENGLPKGSTQLYFVLLPHDVVTCLPQTIAGKPVCSNNFYCAYHSYINPGTSNEIIYADIPFSFLDTTFAKGCQGDGNAQVQLPNGDAGTSDSETRFADVALKYLSHEYIEAVTDPLVNFRTAWVDEEGQEIGDKCNGVPNFPEEEGEPGFDKHAFTPTLGGSAESGTLFNQSIAAGVFYLQSQWDDAAEACLMKPLALGEAVFSSSAATAGTPVSFEGRASDPYEGFEPAWTFGDGASARGASPSHTYASAGEYTVTMTPMDALTGSTGASVSHTIAVAPAPAPTPGPQQSAGGSASSVSSSAPAAATTTPSPVTAQSSPPSSAFSARAGTFAPKTGAISFTEAVAGAGTFNWLATFQNGKFGAFAASSGCQAAFVRLAGRCRPAKIVFAKGSKTVAGAGTVSFTMKPSASAEKALKTARREGRGVPLAIALSFRASPGASVVSHVLTLTVKLKK